MCYHVKNIWVRKIFERWCPLHSCYVVSHVLPLAATLHGEEGSAQVTVMLSLSSAVSAPPLLPPGALVSVSPVSAVATIRWTISRLLSRSDLSSVGIRAAAVIR